MSRPQNLKAAASSAEFRGSHFPCIAYIHVDNFNKL